MRLDEDWEWEDYQRASIRDDGWILCEKYLVLDGQSDPFYVPTAIEDGLPWDDDRQALVKPGQTFTRLWLGGSPLKFEGRFWVNPRHDPEESWDWGEDEGEPEFEDEEGY